LDIGHSHFEASSQHFMQRKGDFVFIGVVTSLHLYNYTRLYQEG